MFKIFDNSLSKLLILLKIGNTMLLLKTMNKLNVYKLNIIVSKLHK